MRQKYVISRDGPNNKLTIKEYAIIDTKVKKPISSFFKQGKFILLCEETYDNKIILGSISHGIPALVAIIRTHNLFPIEPFATKIADNVITLYNSSENGPLELVFDDLDLVTTDIQGD